MSKKSKRNKKAEKANPVNVDEKQIEVGEIKKSVRKALANTDLPQATRMALVKTEGNLDRADTAYQEVIALRESPHDGRAREIERRKAEAARAA